MRFHIEVLAIHIKEHGGIAHEGCLMHVDIYAVVGLHQHRGLDGVSSCALCFGVTGVAVEGFGKIGESGFGEEIFVCVIVSGDTIELMVAGEIEFGQLIFHCKIIGAFLHGEFITESETVIEKTEAHNHLPFGLILCLRGLEIDCHFAEMVAYGGIFTPYGLP